jgi:Leucine-rich repeat (LRR) protein
MSILRNYRYAVGRLNYNLKVFLIVSVTLFQIPQYEQLQVLICNGNSLTTLAGVEHIKHLWKLDVGNNEVLENPFRNVFIFFLR